MKRLIDEEPSVKKRIECREVEGIRSTYGTSILAKLGAENRTEAARIAVRRGLIEAS